MRKNTSCGNLHAAECVKNPGSEDRASSHAPALPHRRPHGRNILMANAFRFRAAAGHQLPKQAVAGKGSRLGRVATSDICRLYSATYLFVGKRTAPLHRGYYYFVAHRRNRLMQRVFGAHHFWSVLRCRRPSRLPTGTKQGHYVSY